MRYGEIKCTGAFGTQRENKILVISAARYELPELQQNGKQPDKVDSIRKYRDPLSAS